MPTDDQQAAFGLALRKLMESHQQTQRQFGEAIGELVRGADKPYAQSTVRDWIEKAAPAPEIVFEMEGYLLVPPGTLSQHLGYLPVGARSVVTVEEALMNDTSIDTTERDILLVLYGVLAQQPLTSATLSLFTRWSLERLVESAAATADLLAENRMQFDKAGRLVAGFDVAPLTVLMASFREWQGVPGLPVPKALLGALAQRYNEMTTNPFADPQTVADLAQMLDGYDEQQAATERHRHLAESTPTQRQFARAASGGLPESEDPERRGPTPPPEPEGP